MRAALLLAVWLMRAGPVHAQPCGLVVGEYDFDRLRCPSTAVEQKRYCKDMASCEEATFHWAICNRKDFDRDEDNMPCEGVCPNVEMIKRAIRRGE